MIRPTRWRCSCTRLSLYLQTAKQSMPSFFWVFFLPASWTSAIMALLWGLSFIMYHMVYLMFLRPRLQIVDWCLFFDLFIWTEVELSFCSGTNLYSLYTVHCHHWGSSCLFRWLLRESATPQESPSSRQRSGSTRWWISM